VKTPSSFILLSAAVLVTLLVPCQLVAQPQAEDLRSLRDLSGPEVPFQLAEPIDISHLLDDEGLCQKPVGTDGVLLDPVFEAIENGPCSWCNSNSNCSTPCIDDNGNQSDCGDYGVCDPCREAIVEVDRQFLGNRASRSLFDCVFRTSYLVTRQSLNAGCPLITTCEIDVESHYVHPWISCCDIAPGCIGVMCP
jgi:hypothetical protein